MALSKWDKQTDDILLDCAITIAHIPGRSDGPWAVASRRINAELSGHPVAPTTPQSCRQRFLRLTRDEGIVVKTQQRAVALPPYKRRVVAGQPVPPSCAELRRQREAAGQPYAWGLGGRWFDAPDAPRTKFPNV